MDLNAGSAGRREWLERRWDRPASPNHLRRGGGGVVMPSRVVRRIGFFKSPKEKGTFYKCKTFGLWKPCPE